VPPRAQQELMRLQLEGWATIGGREVRREAVAADYMMQAFSYQHLVPADHWTVAIGPAKWSRPVWTFADAVPVKLSIGGTSEVRVKVPRGTQLAQVRLELSDPPSGIAIQGVTPVEGDLVVKFEVDGSKAKPGLKGNLIINTLTETPPPAGQVAVRARRALTGVLPALPFEVVGK
jgi:hypothetical protein